MSDYKQKLENFQNAAARLNEGLVKFDAANDLLRDGIIQRFEFTFELAWKTLKALFEDEGLKGINSPKTVLKEAFIALLITDEELWLNMLNDRNSTAHIYSEEMAQGICDNIATKYAAEFERLISKIKTR
jgi:nucleotidyltransferase substrate binding protein (TIGR01987 family)